jgi:mannosyltransferase
MRLALLGNQQLFRDEATSWYLASHSLGDILRLGAQETFPPLYVVLLHGWMALFGDSEAALRLPSVIAGIATVIVTWRWARSAIGETEAWIAGIVVAFSPLLVANARDARMYSLECMFATSAWWLIWLLIAHGGDWAQRRRAIAAIALVLSVVGEVWTLSLGLPSAALQLTFAVVVLLSTRSRISVLAAGCVSLGVLTLAPWLPNLIATATNGHSFWTPRPDLGALITTFGVSLVGQSGDSSPLVLAFAVVPLFGLATMVGLRSTGRHMPGLMLALALTLDFGLVLVVWAFSQFHSIYDPRYLGAAVPPLAIAVGAAASALGRLLRPAFHGARLVSNGVLASLIVVPLLCSTAFASGQSISASGQSQGIEPGREVAQELARVVKPGDVVIAVNAQSYFPLAYYLDRTGEAQRLGIELYEWHSPTAAFFTGWADIDSTQRIEPATVGGVGWRSAVHLGATNSIWVVSLVDSDHARIYFTPLESGQLRETDRIIVQGNGLLAQIRKVVPN